MAHRDDDQTPRLAARIQFRATAAEDAAWRSMADKTGRQMGSIARAALREYLTREGFLPAANGR